MNGLDKGSGYIYNVDTIYIAGGKEDMQEQCYGEQPDREPFEVLRQRVVDKDNVLVVYMEELRDAVHAGKLGKYVITRIERCLRSHGLGYRPAKLPNQQYERVMLFVQGSRVEEIIDAVEHYPNEGVDLLRSVGSNQDADIVSQIRTLVCT